MGRRLLTLAVAFISTIALASPLVHAQGGATSSLAGVVVDSGGGVVPGATVVIRNNATGTTPRSLRTSR
jgi:hypothetical protein